MLTPFFPSKNWNISPAGRIVLVYLLLGMSWILFSDLLLSRIGNSGDAAMLSIIKGWLFVFISAALLYHLIRRHVIKQDLAVRIILASEERLNLVLQSVNDGVWDWDLENGRAYLSPKFFEIVDLQPEGETPDPDFFLSLIHADDRAMVLKVIDDHLGGKSMSTVFEFRTITRQGTLKWILSRGKVVERDADGQPLRILGTITDVSERKKVEESMRQYAHRLLELEEEMRKKLAEELHDEIGRDLTALGLNIAMMHESLPVEMHEKMVERFEDMGVMLESISRTVRGLMSKLRPPVLDDYGLPAALRWHCEQFSKRSGLAVELLVEDGFPRQSTDRELAIFRIAQEAMTNISKHANARTVRISLNASATVIRLSVSDDGAGLDAVNAGYGREGSHWGLTMMRERAEAVNGSFRLETSIGAGTTILVELGRDT